MGVSYEDQLRGFAQGKRLGRLSKAVRDLEGAACDACGSELPRTLFGLKDTVSNRFYFVGQNCLAWLLENGLVARARYRQSAETAYRQEMERRRNGAGLEAVGYPERRPHATDLSSLRRTVLMVQTDREYRVLVRLDDGRRRVEARAEEGRKRLHWLRRDGALLLEPAERDRRLAFALCVLKAYREALARWRSADGNPRRKAAGQRKAEAC